MFRTSVVALLLAGLVSVNQGKKTTPDAPSFSLGSGSYYAPVTLAISETSSSATVYYTTDGSTPTNSSQLYSAPITLSRTTTLRAVAVWANLSSSVTSATFTISATSAPSFSLGGPATYYAPVSLSISEATNCAAVYYTTDGSTPTTSSSLYTGALTISRTTTVSAMAICPGGSASAVTSATYTIAAPYAPSFSPGATGSFYAPVSLSINEATSCAAVYYTTNGSAPTTSSTLYTGPITISSTTSVSAMAICPGGSASAVTSATYTIAAPYAPSFSPGATGSFYAPVSLSINEATNCAAVYYTTNGSAPTTSSAVYAGPITISSTTTVNAMAACPGGNPSPVTSATYTIGTTSAPSFSPGATGTFYAPVSLIINEATNCAAVYYTTNGSTPTTSSAVYTGPITISSTTTVNAMAACPGGSPSPVTSATYTIGTTSAPSFSPLGPFTSSSPVTVSMQEATSCATVYYTTDGTTPTTASAAYTGSFTIGKTMTVSAMAACPGGVPSAVTSATYTISTTYAPSISPGGPGTFYTPVSLSIKDGSTCAAIYYSTDGTTPTTSSTLYTGAFTINATTTVNAVAVCPGGTPSAVTSVKYTISAPYAPSFSPWGPATFYAPFSLSINEGTSCAAVYYTTDGSTPTTSSTLYTGPFTISKTTTVSAMSVCPGGSPSTVTSATFTVSAPYAPTFSPWGPATFYAPFSFSIKEATACAAVYYTTDGSTPTTSSPLYTGAFTISKTTTVSAMSVCPGGPPSTVTSATFTVSAPYAPTFSPWGPATFYAPISLSINEATTCAAVYYTTDGSTPTTSSPLYTTPLTISKTTTVSAMSVCPGGSASTVKSATFTISAPYAPTFSPWGPVTLYGPFSLTIKEATSCAAVYYTADGTTPTTASTLYTGPIPISSTTSVRAMSVCPGGSPSTITSSTYTISSIPPPVFSTGSGIYEKSVAIKISEAVSGAVIYYTTDGTTPTTSSAVYTAPVIFSNSTTFKATFNLQAFAAYPSGGTSPMVSGNFTVLSTTTPVHSQNGGGSFFGMDLNGLVTGTPWPTVQFGTIRLWDSNTSWPVLNPGLGTYQWGNLDKAIQLAQENNAQVIYTFGPTPPWAISTKVPITTIARSNGVVTITTAQPHGVYYNSIYAATDQSSVTIAGVSDSSFNGTFAITGTPSPTTLTYAQSGLDSTSSSGSVSAVCGGAYVPKGCAEAPVSLPDWDEFVTALIDHVGPGVVRYWEIWNEANIAQIWRGNPKALVSMAADARRIIKAVDPNAVILSPSTTVNFETPQQCANYDPRCGSKWIGNWLALGGSSSIDGVAFHGYPTMGVTPEQIQGAITLQQLAMNQNGIGAMPLVDTESSWGANSALTVASDQAAFVARHLLLEHSLGVQAAVWYAYDNASWGQLWSATSGVNPAGDAYDLTAQWITSATVTQPCAPTSADPTTFTCGYSRPNGYTALAIWNTGGSKAITVPQGYSQYRDLYGNLIASPAGSSITISTAPILLETRSAF